MLMIKEEKQKTFTFHKLTGTLLEFCLKKWLKMTLQLIFKLFELVELVYD